MPDQRQHQVALITGAGSGIGRQFALTLASKGLGIAALDRSADDLRSLEQQLTSKQQKIAVAVADVADATALSESVKQLEARLGPIDLLIASAGIGRETSAQPFDLEAFTATIQVNLIGVANSIHAVLPGMVARGRGHLVALSSLASYRGLPKMWGYCASKSGLNAMMEGLRIELKPHGIDVTTFCPGWIRTPMTDAVEVPMPDLMDVDYAVEQMLHAIQRRKRFVAFPGWLSWRVWLLKVLPPSISDWLIERMLRKVN